MQTSLEKHQCYCYPLRFVLLQIVKSVLSNDVSISFQRGIHVVWCKVSAGSITLSLLILLIQNLIETLASHIGLKRSDYTFWLVLSHCMKSAQIRSSFWSVFSRIRTEYGEIRSPNIQSECGKIWTRKSSVFGHFSRSLSI